MLSAHSSFQNKCITLLAGVLCGVRQWDLHAKWNISVQFSCFCRRLSVESFCNFIRRMWPVKWWHNHTLQLASVQWVSLGYLRARVSACPVLFLLLIDFVTLLFSWPNLSVVISVFTECSAPLASLTCNQVHCPTCVPASATDTQRNKDYQRHISCCQTSFFYFWPQKWQK